MNDLWTRARSKLSARLSAEARETWLDPVELDVVEGESVVLRVPNRFHGEWLAQHYQGLVLEACSTVLDELGDTDLVRPSRLRCIVDERLKERAISASKEAAEAAVVAAQLARSSEPPSGTFLTPRGMPGSNGANTGGAPGLTGTPVPGTGTGTGMGGTHPATPIPELNPKYVFESFVVGSSNQLAHAASLAAATTPGRRYNPLFLCGGVGLGKTHLVNAVGQKIRESNPGARILYVSAEKFTNDFISAIRTNSMEEFRTRYRSTCDVLLMDDIQFIAKRESTMEEFFHTFNALHHLDKQIVVTSDVYPENLEGMEARIISRFQSGMVADIQPPDIDTRVAILEKKAEQEGIELDKSVANFLAQYVKSNVRELEGTLLRLAVQAELLGRRMDLELARMALRNAIPRVESATSVDDVQKAVCDYFQVRIADLKGKRRHRSVTFPRMLAMYLCRQHLSTSYPELGERFGGKDHTTVISAVRKIEGLVGQGDADVLGPLEVIQRRLGL